MSCYRLISKVELEKTKKKGFLAQFEKDFPNDPITICVFKSYDEKIIKEYAPTIADKRNLQVGDELFLIEIQDYDKILKSDESASAGWEDSFVIYESVANKSISVVATVIIVKDPVNKDCIGEIKFFQKVIGINDFI